MSSHHPNQFERYHAFAASYLRTAVSKNIISRQECHRINLGPEFSVSVFILPVRYQSISILVLRCLRSTLVGHTLCPAFLEVLW